jgi:hypothetical protein
MNVVRIPRPRPSAMNPDRPVNALLLAQVEHLQHAERRLPLRYRTEVYTHAIKTEGEAAAYIRQVTEAIHAAHTDAEAQRTKPKSSSKARTKSSSKKRRKK